MGNKYSLNSALAHIGGALPDLECSVIVEVFNWKSQEFPQEYAVIYTSIYDSTSRCVFRVSANRYKARLTMQDDLCLDGAQVSMAVEVTAVSDAVSGKYSPEPPTVDFKGIDNWKINGTNLPSPMERLLSYGKDDSSSANILVKKFTSDHRSNFSDDRLVVKHYLKAFHDEKESLDFWVAFQCHVNKGLVVELAGPSLQGRQYIHRIVEGDPEDYSNDNLVVGNNDHPFRKHNLPRTSKVLAATGGGAIQATGGAISATGAVNNVNSRTQGSYNNSVFNRCVFPEASNPEASNPEASKQ